MKKDIILYLFFSCLCNIIHGQTKELPDDSLILKHHIKTITSWLSRDSIKNEAEVCYKYNSLGKLTVTEYFPDIDSIIDDTSFVYNFYFYENNKLVKELCIENSGSDTLQTFYIYDNSNNIIETKIKCLDLHWDYSIKNKYDFQNRLVQIIYDNGPSYVEQGIDSLFYKNDRVILDINHFIDRRIAYKYNVDGTLYLKSDGRLNDTTRITFLNYFYYDNKLLISEKECYTFRLNYSERTYKYYYNDRGLVQKIERYSHDKLYNYTILTYEYY